MSLDLDFDVMVIGGGLVGAASALALHEEGLRVALIEAGPAPVLPNDDSWDSRIYAISPGNARFLSGLGAWDTLAQARIAPIEAMQIWGDDGVAELDFSAYEAGAENLGYIVESRLMQAGLWDRLQAQPEIAVFTRAQCVALRFTTDFAELTLAEGRTLRASLAVGADGGQSWVRQSAGLRVTTSDYRQSGVVANFVTEKPHASVARQWFREDGILAWLPLPGNRMSMVWSTSPDNAQRLLKLSPEALSHEVAEAGGAVLGQLTCITPPAAFPLRLQNAETLVIPRLVLVGDAAHLVHPLAGQGVNLGFHDVIALTKVMRERSKESDVGDYGLLRQYERSRQLDIKAMQSLTDGLHTLFSSQWPMLGPLRNLGMKLTNRQPWLKRFLMTHAMT
jgi:2-octaprenylphenol hydroxylase